MNHGKPDNRRAPEGKQHRQKEAPSKLEEQARDEDRDQEYFTQSPPRDSSRQESPKTQPQTVAAPEDRDIGEEEREKQEHPPARKSDLDKRLHGVHQDVPGQN